MSSFDTDLEYAQPILSSVFSPSLSTALLAFVEEQEYDDAESILSDLEDATDSNMLEELHLTDPLQIHLFTAIVTTIFAEHDHTVHLALCLETDFALSIDEKRVDGLTVPELTRLIATELNTLRVAAYDVNALFLSLHSNGVDGAHFVSALNAPRHQLRFAKMLSKCAVPMGKAKAIYKAIRIRIESQQQFEPSVSSTAPTSAHSVISPFPGPMVGSKCLNSYFDFPRFQVV